MSEQNSLSPDAAAPALHASELILEPPDLTPPPSDLRPETTDLPPEPSDPGSEAPSLNGESRESAEPSDVKREPWVRLGHEIFSGFQTLLSAAVYATLIVTFGFQVARVDGLSMAPTLEDRDRLIVNKLVYELGDPRPGDIVMLYYPLNPEKMFVKRVIAKEAEQGAGNSQPVAWTLPEVG